MEKERNEKGDLSGGRERKKEKETIREDAGKGKKTGYGSHRMKKENVRDLGDQTEKKPSLMRVSVSYTLISFN